MCGGPSTTPYGPAGVVGTSDAETGVSGISTNGIGIVGVSQAQDAINGTSASSQHAGVSANNTGGGYGLWASSTGVGVFARSDNADGVQGISNSPQNAGVSATNTTDANTVTVPYGYALRAFSNNTGVWAQGNPAAYFQGDVLVTGDVILTNPSASDIAEDFDVDDEQINLEPGTVLSINAEGRLCASSLPYDTRVAGVVSGAGNLKPGVVLERISSATSRSPIALLGKAFCKVDASFGSIAAGDLLTTSPTPGHAMKASDKSLALGAIIGKALASFDGRLGLIPIMVSLR